MALRAMPKLNKVRWTSRNEQYKPREEVKTFPRWAGGGKTPKALLNPKHQFNMPVTNYMRHEVMRPGSTHQFRVWSPEFEEEKRATLVQPWEEGRVNLQEFSVDLVRRSKYYSQLPAEDKRTPEIAVFGRSNAGKSSLINMLCGIEGATKQGTANKKAAIATVGSTAGHTKLCSHFRVDWGPLTWYLVDLPGVEGHDRSIKRSMVRTMDRIVTDYVTMRRTLGHILYLVDSSIPVQEVDLESIAWLTRANVSLSVVFTKCDKGGDPECLREAPEGPAEALSQALLEMPNSPWARVGADGTALQDLPFMLQTSSVNAAGRMQLLEYIVELRKSIETKPRKARKRGNGTTRVRSRSRDQRNKGPSLPNMEKAPIEARGVR